MVRQPGLSAGDTVLALSTPSFDISCLEIFLPLMIGARLAVPDRAAATDGAFLGLEIQRLGVTLLQATPTTWRLLLESGWKGDPGLAGLCGGEALPRELARALLARMRILWNGYGPTEATVYATMYEVADEPGSVSIGRGVSGASLRVVDPGFKPVPVGVAGELHIGGAGLARGYAGRPDLTAERFVPDPFTEASGGRLYRTGDLVRWLADGRLDFLGRADHQVKVRGFRIELEEIESALQAHPAVGGVVVLARELVGETALVAYLTAAPGHAGPLPEGEALREHLRARLPSTCCRPPSWRSTPCPGRPAARSTAGRWLHRGERRRAGGGAGGAGAAGDPDSGDPGGDLVRSAGRRRDWSPGQLLRARRPLAAGNAGDHARARPPGR